MSDISFFSFVWKSFLMLVNWIFLIIIIRHRYSSSSYIYIYIIAYHPISFRWFHSESTFSVSCNILSIALWMGFSSLVTYLSPSLTSKGTLSLVLICAPSFLFKEEKLLLEIKWTANEPNHLNENLPPFQSMHLWFFRRTFWPTLFMLCTWWSRL